MAETWSISGVDLFLELRGSRVRVALESALRDAVRAGRLAAGTRLPSSRSLSSDLGISRNTVAAAYAQLTAEGWFEARQGSGTRVAARASQRQAPDHPPAAEPAHVRFDLRPGSPALSGFPTRAWLAAARRALHGARYEELGSVDPRGAPQLRGALADYLGRARGVQVTPERIVVCSGFNQGLLLLCWALRGLGAASVAIESYGLPRTPVTISASGLSPRPLNLDAGGALVEEFGDADAVLLTPAHQFPLGTPLAAARRVRAVEWARERGAVLIEDDYDGEFRYDRQPLSALQALAPDHVAYAGTASKSLAPGLRLGWLVLPADLVEETLSVRRLTDGPSALEQLTLAELISSGEYDRHVRRARLAYRRRRDTLVAALRRAAPAARITGIDAGLHAVVELPAGMAEREVIERACQRGLAVEGLEAYRLGSEPQTPALAVGYGTPPEHAFSGAVARLTAVLAAA